MRNFPLVRWMLGWPTVLSYGRSGRCEPPAWWMAVALIGIWVGGGLLYERPTRDR